MWRELEDSKKIARTVWSVSNECFDDGKTKEKSSTETTKENLPQAYMINYRVDNLVEFLAELKENCVTIVDGVDDLRTVNLPIY